MPRKPPAPTTALPRGYGYIQTVAAPDGLHKVQARWRDGTANRSKTFTAATEQACRDAAIDHLMRVHRDRRDGRYVLPSTMTVADLMDVYLERSRSGWRGATYGAYAGWSGRWIIPHLGRVRLSELSVARVQRMVDTLSASGLAPRTVRNVLRLLGGALGHAVDMELIPRNYASKVKSPQTPRTRRPIWSRDDVLKVYDHVAGDPFMTAFYRVSLSTGVRPGELRALSWQDVDLDKRVLHVRRTMTRDDQRRTVVGKRPKTGTERTIALAPTCVTALVAWKQVQVQTRRNAMTWDIGNWIFTSHNDGRIMSDNGLRLMHERTIRDAGVPRITLHGLRHSFATLAMEQGAHPKVVSEVLGHSTTTTTLDLYQHVSDSFQRAMIEGLADSIGGAGTALPR